MDALVEAQPQADEIDEQPSIHLVARNPQEMANAQADLRRWLSAKVTETKNELADVRHAHEVAKQNNWSASVLGRQVERAQDRLTFYTKVLEAVEAGYTIIPNFPIDLFAVRVKRAKPRKIVKEIEDASQWADPARHIPEQKSEALESGAGRYVPPAQRVRRTEWREKDDKGKEILIKQAWTVEFGNIVFPIAAARPEVMSATAEAMALRVFDEIGICPPQPRPGVDPLIVGRITMKKHGGYLQPKSLSFLIAWNLDLRTL